MLFNSVDFAIFLPIAFIFYWLIPEGKTRSQNFLIVIASFIFYGWWDWRFLSLIILSICIDYFIGLSLHAQTNQRIRNVLLALSLTANLGILGVFKYYNFFLENIVTAFSLFGHELTINSLDIILPVGISFYTFQTLSYTIDIYKGQLQPTRDIIAFAAFISFFPQLVAGPIERATSLLPQFQQQRVFKYNNAIDGLRQILWGLFKKIAVADSCAEFANQIFDNYAYSSGSMLALGALFFTFQIYGDFSGYADIAIGLAKLFGIRLMRNFAFPYFSRDMAEFWRRWHISLSTWFRDYLYIPLGGSRRGSWIKVRNVLIIFIMSGFWHGPSWTFIIWGILNAIYVLPLLFIGSNRQHLEIVAKGKTWPTIFELLSMLMTFGCTMIGWIFFRAEDIDHAIGYLSRLFSPSLLSIPRFASPRGVAVALMLIVVLILMEWWGREQQYAIEKIGLYWPRPWRWGCYYLLAMMIMLFAGQQQEFIYFQF